MHIISAGFRKSVSYDGSLLRTTQYTELAILANRTVLQIYTLPTTSEHILVMTMNV